MFNLIKRFLSNKTKISKNIFINSVAQVSYLAIINLLVYPLVSHQFDTESFSKIIVTIGIVQFFSTMIGYSLQIAYLRTISDNPNSEIRTFKSALLFTLIMTSFFLIVLSIVLFTTFSYFETLNIYTIIILELVLTIRKALFGFRRLEMNYIPIAFSNLLASTLCLVFVYFNFDFFLSYSIGEFIGIGALLRKEDIFFKYSPKEFRFFSINFVYLVLWTAIINFTNYLDKFFVKILLTDEAVIHYFIAMSLSKIVMMLVGVVTSVLFSYYTNISIEEVLSMLFKQLKAVLRFSPFIYPSMYLTSYMGIKILYPNYLSQVKFILFSAVLATFIISIKGIVNAGALKILGIKMLLRIEIASLLSYLALIMIFSRLFGIQAFFLSYTIVNLCVVSFIILKLKDTCSEQK